MSDIRQRLDRLPVTSMHKKVMVALAFAYFFELADLNTFGYAATGILGQWHIQIHTVALITSASFVGMFFGSTIGGQLADKYGRKRAFIVSVMIYTIASLLNALSWNVVSLALFRLATGVGLSSVTVIANTYLSETFPARVRGKFMAIVMTIGLIGIPATAWVARFVIPMAPWGWRMVFVWGALGMFVLPLAARLRESPRWLLLNGRSEEAEEVVAAYERAAIAQFGELVEPQPTPAGIVHAKKGSFVDLFNPLYRGRTVVVLLLWILATLGFYGFIAWVPTLLVTHGFTVVKSLNYASLIAICNPLGAALALVLIERFERKFLFAAFAVYVAIVVTAYGWTFSPTLIVIFGAMVVIGIQAATVVCYTYTPEIYPTEVRGAGMGLAYGTGRLANVFGPFIVSALYGAAGYLSIFLFIAACYLAAAAMLSLVGLRVTGRSLENAAAETALVKGRTPA
jgi:putative MFS transporter